MGSAESAALDRSLEIGSQAEPFVLLPDFFLQKLRLFFLEPIAHFSGPQVVQELKFQEALENYEARSDDPFVSRWSLPSYDDFLAQTRLAQPLFDQDEIQKWVPYVEFSTSEKPSFDSFCRILLNLLRAQKQNGGSLVGYWGQGEGFLGLTPERLFEVCANKLKTHALAGTDWQSKGINFEADEKEQSEHQLVVEDLVSKLSRWGLVKNGKREVIQYGVLRHLMTPIELDLQQPFSLRKGLEALHPTPALGGHPSQKVFEWMKTLESHRERGAFGAPLSFLLPDKSLYSLVLIRTLFWSSHGSRLPVGCGFVKNSDPEVEWLEIQEKFRATVRLMGLS